MGKDSIQIPHSFAAEINFGHTIMSWSSVSAASVFALLSIFRIGVLALPQENSPLSNKLTLSFPQEPPQGGQVIDGSFQSFSIEYAYMGDFGGNLT